MKPVDRLFWLGTADKRIQRTKSLALFCLTLTFIVSLILFAQSGLANATQNTTSIQSTEIKKGISSNVKNIILVHGAWTDGSLWSQVIPILQKAGYRVIAVQLPLHSLSDDVATVKRTIDLLNGPTILVGWSYGGVVVDNAAYNNPNVKGLVFIAAFVTQEGQSVNDIFDPKKLPKDLFIVDNEGFMYLNWTKYPGGMAQDANLTQASVMAAVQKPINYSIFAEKSGPPAWKELPTWYQVSENDRILPPTFERLLAKQMNATTISIPSSHASPVSHPHEVAQLILNATKGITK